MVADLIYGILGCLCCVVFLVAFFIFLFRMCKQEEIRTQKEQERRDRIVANMAENNVLLADLCVRVEDIEKKIFLFKE